MTTFLTLCADWLAVGCLLIWGVWFSDKLRTPVSFAPVLGVSFGMVFLQLAGVVRLLWPGAQLLYLGAAVLLVRRPRKSWQQVLGSPAVLGFLAGALVLQLAWLMREPRFQTWDEFSHWGMFFKSVYHHHSLIQWTDLTSAHNSYPQGVPALYALTGLARNAYKERDVLFTAALPLLASAAALLGLEPPGPSRGLWLRRLCGALGTPLLFWIFSWDTPYATAYMDAPLGALFGAALLLVALPPLAEQRRGLAVGLLCAALMTTKELGFVFALCVLGVWTLQTLWTARLRGLLPLACGAVPPVLMGVIWKGFVSFRGCASDQFSELGPAYFLRCWQEARSGEDPYFLNVWNVFYARVRSYPLLFGWSTFKLACVCAVLSVAATVLLRRRGKGIQGLAPVCMIAYLPCYLFVLFYVYISCMSPYEALQAASYERYSCCFFIGWLLLLAGCGILLLPPRWRQAWAAALAVVSIWGMTLLPDVVSLPYEDWRDRQIGLAAQVRQAAGEDTVWILSAEPDTAIQNMWYYQYELAPTRSLVGYQAYLQQSTDVFSVLDSQQPGYLLLFGADDQFVSQYGALADDGLAAARQDPAALYRLTRTGDGWSLQKIALAF